MCVESYIKIILACQQSIVVKKKQSSIQVTGVSKREWVALTHSPSVHLLNNVEFVYILVKACMYTTCF